MEFLGVDACSSGWFAGILDSGTLSTELYSSEERDLDDLLSTHSDAERILIDIPIGLPKTSRRKCDEQAKNLLGCRGISVFYPPCQAVLEANHNDYQQANNLHRNQLDHGLSQQAWHLLPKIRELDSLLKETDDLRSNIFESHPELCFYAMNNRTPIAYSKQSERGRERRLNVLREVLGRQSEEAYDGALDTYYRKDVARDDILDALILTAAAQSDSLISLPEERDHQVQRQVIVYPNPTHS